MDYTEFLMKKTKRELPTGIEVEVKNESLFEWQKKVVQFALKRGSAALFEDTGLGKGQPYGSKVLTTTGWKAIETLTTKDMVFARDGKAYRVKGVYPKQELETYRFYYTDDTSLVFDIDHLHFVRTYNCRGKGKDFKVLSTKELIGKPLHVSDSGIDRRVYDVPLTQPVEFEERKFFISPYILGCLIGDGGITRQITISRIKTSD